MKLLTSASMILDAKSRRCLFTLFVTVFLLCVVYFISSTSISSEYKERLLRWRAVDPDSNRKSNRGKEGLDLVQGTKSCTCIDSFQNTTKKCENSLDTLKKTEYLACERRCRPPGSEALPEGIVSQTSNLEMRPLWSSTEKNVYEKKTEHPMNLLAIAVGIKQKTVVDNIVKKFSSSNFVIMLFHYDGIVDEWRDMEWSHRAIHVSALNQTKWWFAKRFLHPDIVAEYNYIFLWDEDLGVENFHPGRYLSIIKYEGLEVSQPALDPSKSDVYHPITGRQKDSRVHRRFYKSKGHGLCDDNSRNPPCTGWVEMMAPVFSRAAWRCVWYMIQNDLIHAWGLDIQLGYCAQGDRTRNVGVVDSEYIVHLGLPTLGVLERDQAQSKSNKIDHRPQVRQQSFNEMQIFKKRWKDAERKDNCWTDPYKVPVNQSIH